MSSSLTMVSFYAVGSFMSGLALVYLMRRFVRPVMLMVVLPVVTFFAAMAVWFYPTVAVCRWASFVIGASAAGGVFQIGVTVLMEFFPQAKARYAMVYMLTSSVAAAACIRAIGWMAHQQQFAEIMLVNAGAALLCFLIGVWIAARYYKTFVIDKPRWGEAQIVVRQQKAP